MKNDLISRSAAIQTAERMYKRCDTSDIEDYHDLMVEALTELPPAQPGWIPCETELPKENGQYIITVKYEHVDGYEDIYSEHGEWVDGHWDFGLGYYHCGRVEKVLAWMPLPKPYREGGQE